jgi:hypothetical protein
MANVSRIKEKDAHNSGHGSLGMGGQPSDDPRDLESGREGLKVDDLGGGTGPVPGAFGGENSSTPAPGTTGAVAGVSGDRDATDAIDRAAKASRGTGKDRG